MDQRGGHMKRNFKKLRVEKVDEKDGVICLVSMFPSWVMVLQWTKKVHLLQFCADLSMKPKSVKAIYIYVSESSHYTFLDNLWTIIQEGNMETWQMTPFFFSPFSVLFLTFISELENAQNSFLFGLHFGLFWSLKYLNFWPKVTDPDNSLHFSRK